MADNNSAGVDEQALAQRYSTVAVALHWIIALALAFQLALGFAMPNGPEGFGPYQLHKSVGITILLLSLARLAWRVTHRPPDAVEGGFQGFLAKAVHTLLYVFMIGAPLTGWALVSTSSIVVPTVFWGVIPWPHLPLPQGLGELFEQGHELLAWVGLALIVLHVAGALRHQLLLRDGLLRRMAPGGRAAAALGLLALVVAVYFGTGMYVANRYLVPAQEREAAGQAAGTVEPVTSDLESTEPASEEEPAAADEAATEEESAEEPVADGPPPIWSIQPGGRLGFSLGGGQGPIRGSFSDWSGEIRMDPDRPETADVRITVRLASATLGDATMDSTVQGAEFFGTSANPVATWRSTSVRRTGPNRYSAQGTLSLKGASRPQAITFTLSGQGLRRQVQGSATVDRTAFGVGTGDTAAGLASAVSVEFEFEALGRTP
jgi:cytochrome b561/polyisoprenoid-binding protein YceI